MQEETTASMTAEKQTSTNATPNGQRPSGIWIVLAVVLLLALMVGLVFAVIAMVKNPDQTETIRDIVIIMMAVESLLIGIVLITLIVQLARLTAMLQNEIKPILDSTNETIGTLRGTSTFLSDKLVKPVVRVNSAFAAFRRAIDFLRHGK
jgi:membrane protein implicated in regulation of membrane protease activity